MVKIHITSHANLKPIHKHLPKANAVPRISRKLKHKHSQHLERWLVSYADYMTLMFALFVVLYAMSIVKEESFDVLSESLGEIFQITGDDGAGTPGDGTLTQQVSQAGTLEGNSLNQEKGTELVDDNILINESDEKRLGSPLQALKQDLQSALYDLTENGFAQLEQDDDWLTIELSSGLLFASGSAAANPSASVVLGEVARILLKVNNYVEVRGYTDNLAINNEIFSSNWELSAARAASITNMLEQFGVVQQRLGIKANGANDPVASNEDAIGRSRNRRVVIALSKYSYIQIKPDAPDKKELGRQLTGNIERELPEYGRIKVIRLPNGGIRITTTQEAEETKSASESNQNNN